MPWKLDRKREFAEIWGEGNVTGFMQDGREFDRYGEPLPGQVPDKVVQRPRGYHPSRPGVTTAVGRAQNTGLAALDDDTLRGMIEVRGDEWKGRESAIAALEADPE